MPEEQQPFEHEPGPKKAAASSLEETDRASAAVATQPRVALADIEAAIAERYDMLAAEAMHAAVTNDAALYASLAPPENNPISCLPLEDERHPLQVLSICILVMRNGFTVIGKSAPASRENFDAALGRRFAYEDAVRQLWPLMGFALRDRLWRDSEDAARFHKVTNGD